MSTSAGPWKATVDLILAHPTAPLIAVMQRDGRLSIPQLSLSRDLWSPEVDVTISAVADQFGLAVLCLRGAFIDLRSDEHYVRIGYVLELRQPEETLPAGWRWAPRAELAQVLATPQLGQAVDAVLTELEEGCVSALRPPWAWPGWFAVAESWIKQQLTALGFTLQSPIEQVKNWSISCVLRAPCSEGAVYFKVASGLALFANEPLVLEELSRRFPAHIPRPLAIERDQHWMLLADFGEPLQGKADFAVWAETLRLYGEIQRAAVSEVDALLAAGYLDRRLEVLESQIEPLLNDPTVRRWLKEGELEGLHAAAPRLKALCRQLHGYHIPPSLVHGDLHPGNIAVQNANYLFFDWTDACIAHPFLDLITIEDIDAKFPEIPNAWQRLLDGYLVVWSAYGSIEQLREAWHVAQPLAALHQVVSYQHIVAVLEPASENELGWGLRYWLGKLLKILKPAEVVGKQ